MGRCPQKKEKKKKKGKEFSAFTLEKGETGPSPYEGKEEKKKARIEEAWSDLPEERKKEKNNSKVSRLRVPPKNESVLYCFGRGGGKRGERVKKKHWTSALRPKGGVGIFAHRGGEKGEKKGVPTR